jgi:hypothetical protein
MANEYAFTIQNVSGMNTHKTLLPLCSRFLKRNSGNFHNCHSVFMIRFTGIETMKEMVE